MSEFDKDFRKAFAAGKIPLRETGVSMHTHNFPEGETGMARYRKKPIVVDAVQWFKNGDHPDDGPSDQEGKVVRYYRHPGIDGNLICQVCDRTMHRHGFIDIGQHGHKVCPGDWIITGVDGERYPCNPDRFGSIYEKVDEDETELPVGRRHFSSMHGCGGPTGDEAASELRDPAGEAPAPAPEEQSPGGTVTTLPNEPIRGDSGI